MTLRVAVAGAGYFAQFHLEAWKRIEQQGLVKLVAVAEPDPARLKQALEKHGIAKGFADAGVMLREIDVDLFDIATPPATHLDLVRRAAARGIDCISQKPLAPTYDEACEIVEVAETADIALVVHENFRWMPWFREMRHCLDTGLIGTPHAVSVRLRPGDGQGPAAYLDRQPYFQTMPRLLVHETAIHFIDAFRFLLGEVCAVTARLRRVNPAIAGEDAGYVLFEFADGATALIDGNRLNDHVAANPRLTMGEHWLEGSGGVMRLDGDGQLHWKPHRADETPHAYDWENRGFAGDCVYAQQRHIAECMVEKRTPVNTGREYLRNYAIEEAVYRSHAERRTVDI